MMATEAQIYKQGEIAEKVVFVDGLNGTGKSILGPILASFQKLEKMRIEHIYEYLAILNDLKKIDVGAAVALVRLYVDLGIYNSLIGREVNLRIHDDSGLLNNPFPLKNIMRLFSSDGDQVLENIQKTKPILQLMTHQSLGVGQLLFQALENRIHVLEMVRHPLYLLEHWFHYIHRYGTDAREFSISIKYGNEVLPWFASGWEKKYLSLTNMDRVIYSIDWLTKKMYDFVDSLPATNKSKVLFIPFEKFVTQPEPYLVQMEDLLQTKRSSATQAVLKKQRCPRAVFSAGKGHKHYGWKKASKALTEGEDFERRWKFAQQNASSEGLSLLTKISADYEARYSLHIEKVVP